MYVIYDEEFDLYLSVFNDDESCTWTDELRYAKKLILQDNELAHLLSLQSISSYVIKEVDQDSGETK